MSFLISVVSNADRRQHVTAIAIANSKALYTSGSVIA